MGKSTTFPIHPFASATRTMRTLPDAYRRLPAHPDRVGAAVAVGRRNRQRVKLAAAVGDYRDAQGNVLRLRGSLPPGARREYADVLASGLHREDAWQRALELLFERLAVSWTIAGVVTDRQRELLGRYRMALADERAFVREALREHVTEHFPELEAP